MFLLTDEDCAGIVEESSGSGSGQSAVDADPTYNPMYAKVCDISYAKCRQAKKRMRCLEPKLPTGVPVKVGEPENNKEEAVREGYDSALHNPGVIAVIVLGGALVLLVVVAGLLVWGYRRAVHQQMKMKGMHRLRGTAELAQEV